jgi:tetratricopeptide (TPR) repeat protein
MLEEAVRRRAAAYGEQDRRTSMALSTLANAYAMNGELSPAIAAHRRALAAAELSFGASHPEAAIVRQNLADDYLYGLKGEEAVAELQKSVSTLRAANGPHNREVVMGTTDLGLAYLVSGQNEQALDAFESANAEWAATFPKHPIRAAALLGRYNALVALGRPGSKEDLELALKLGGELPPFELGRVQLALGMAKNDVPLVKAAKKNLETTSLPLIAEQLAHADEWLLAHAGPK